jgi:F-type H+-transporting ATPase subunit b
MVADAKRSASSSLKMIEQKAAIESEKNAAMAELKLQVSLSLSIAEKLLKDELSNKTQTKLVEKC